LIQDFNALTVCVLAGAPWILFGVLFGGYHWGLSLRTGVAATAGTTILAALPIILGFQCLLTALVLDIIYQPTRPLVRMDGAEPEIGIEAGAIPAGGTADSYPESAFLQR